MIKQLLGGSRAMPETTSQAEQLDDLRGEIKGPLIIAGDLCLQIPNTIFVRAARFDREMPAEWEEHVDRANQNFENGISEKAKAYLREVGGSAVERMLAPL